MRLLPFVRSFRFALVLGAVAAGLIWAGAVRASTTAWTVEPSPNPAGSKDSYLSGVAATSSTNAWAVGYYNTGNADRTLIERWDGTAWKIQPSPNVGASSDLYGVAATSSTNAWAVGLYYDGSTDRALVEHWNGTAWKVQPSPKPGSYDELEGVAATSSTNAWAVGEYFDSSGAERTLVEHWNGTAWKVQPSPSFDSYDVLFGVAATSSTNAWTAGDYGVRQTLVEHWNGTAWKIQPSPNPDPSDGIDELLDVAATSATNAWAVGSYDDGTAFRTLVELWNGTAWKHQPSPDVGGSSTSNEFYGVAATSATNAWAVGDYLSPTAYQTLIERWNGTAWTHQPSPNPGGPKSDNELRGVAATSPTNAWAVGLYINSSDVSQTLIERWSGPA